MKNEGEGFFAGVLAPFIHILPLDSSEKSVWGCGYRIGERGKGTGRMVNHICLGFLGS